MNVSAQRRPSMNLDDAEPITTDGDSSRGSVRRNRRRARRGDDDDDDNGRDGRGFQPRRGDQLLGDPLQGITFDQFQGM